MLPQVYDEAERRRSRLATHRQKIRRVPVKRLTGPRKALQWLFPYSLDTYPGQWKGFAGLLGVSVATLKHVLAGRRPLSREGRDRLIAALRSDLEQGQAILAELEAYEPPVKRNPMTHIHGAKARANEKADQLSRGE